MYTSLLTAVFALFVAAAPVQTEPPQQIEGKDLSDLLRRWPREYVGWIITDTERDRYKILETDEMRLEFIERFWARRDPFPETLGNEYRAKYLENYAYVANHFGAGKPGWATDRGRIYLLLGPPHSIQQNPMGRYSLERPSEIWSYNNLPIPGIPPSLDITFVDFKGTGEHEIVSDLESTAPVVMQFGTAESNLLALAMRRGRLGMEDPRTGFSQFREVDPTRLAMREFDLQQQLVDIQNPERTIQLQEFVETSVTFDRLSLQAASGMVYTEEGGVKIPVSIAVPYRELTASQSGEQAQYDLDYIILLTDEEGNEAARAEDRLTIRLSQEQYSRAASQHLAIEESLEVEPGRYKLQAILRDNAGERLGTVEDSLDVPTQPQDGLSLSSLFLAGTLIKGMPEAPRPFQFGTVRVVPSLDRLFAPDQQLGVYLQAYGTLKDSDGRKKVKVDFFVMRDERLYMGVPASHLFPDTEPVGISASIPLRKCTPGSYVLRVRVTDEVNGQQAEQDASFTVEARPESGGQ
jgi:GWxTD domain-containing protein